MVLVVCGNFKPEDLLKEIKKRLIPKENQGEIKRIYPEEPNTINKKSKEVEMEVSLPLFMIGFKDSLPLPKNVVEKHIAIHIILNMLLGKSSELYKKLYNSGDLIVEPDFDYEFSKEYAHVLISGQAKNPNKILEEVTKTLKEFKQNGLDDEHFTRIKRKIYGDYVTEYNNVSDIARMFLTDTFKGINTFDYIEKFEQVTKQYTEKVLNEVFSEDKMVLSVIKPKK